MKIIGEYWVQFLMKNPWRNLSLVLVFLIFSAIGLTQFHSNFTPRVWFKNDSQEIVNLDDFEKRFGSDQFVSIAISTKKDRINLKDIEQFKKITEAMWLLPDVMRVETISNYNDIRGLEDEVVIEPLFEPENLDIDPEGALKKINLRLKDIGPIKNFLMSKGRDFFVFYGHMKPYFGEEPDHTELIQKTRDVIEKFKDNASGDYDYFLLGNVSVTNAFRAVAKKDNNIIMPLMALFICVIILWLYRRPIVLINILSLTILTVISSYGIMCWLGHTYNNILAALPGILLAICIADSVHIFSGFYAFLGRQESKVTETTVLEALKFSLLKNFMPTVLTTITTSLSFLTISFTDLIPIRGLGQIAGIGTVIAWFFSYLMISAFVMKFPHAFISKEGKSKSGFKLMRLENLVDFIDDHKNKIIALFLFVSVGGGYLATKNIVDSDPLNYFSPNVPIKKAYNIAKDKMGGLRGIDLVFDSGSKEGIKNPEFLRKIESFTEFALKEKEITQVRSIIDVIKEVNLILNPNLDEGKLPSTKEEVAQMLFLYTLGLPAGTGIESQVSTDNRFLRMKITWITETTKESIIKEKFLLTQAKERFDLNGQTGGVFPLYSQINKRVVKSFTDSISMAILMVSLIMLVVFKDFFIAILSLFPNVIPIIVGGATLYLMNIYVDIGTSLVSAVCLGIAVDDTIHFVSSYIAYKNQGHNAKNAIRLVFESTGRALLVTTLLLVVGFGSFIMADFLPNHYFGVLCSVVLTFALITDLFFLPAILLKWQK